MNIEDLKEMIASQLRHQRYTTHFEGDEFTKFLRENANLIANAKRLADAAQAFLTLFNDGAIQLYEVDDEAEGCFDELEKATKDAIGKTCRCGRVHYPTVVNCLWCNDQTPWAKEMASNDE